MVKTKYFRFTIGGLICISLFFSGFYIGHNLFPKVITKEVVKENEKIIHEKGDIQTKTEIVYVPKIIDKQTGEKEKTDIELNSKKPEINVKVNDKPIDIYPSFEENMKFENGKLVLEQNSKFNLNIELPKPKREIEFGIKLDTNPQIDGMIIIPRKDKGSCVGSAGYNFDEKKFVLGFGITW